MELYNVPAPYVGAGETEKSAKGKVIDAARYIAEIAVQTEGLEAAGLGMTVGVSFHVPDLNQFIIAALLMVTASLSSPGQPLRTFSSGEFRHSILRDFTLANHSTRRWTCQWT